MLISNIERNAFNQQKTFFKGVIEDNNDPEMMGRVRVRVLGVHSASVIDVPVESLPWSPILKSLDWGGYQSGYGLTSTPTNGTWVLCIPDNTDLTSFIVIGGICGINQTKQTEGGFRDPTGAYPLEEHLTIPDSHLDNLSVDKYIKMHTIYTPGNHKIQIDDDADHMRMLHANGSEILIKPESIVITSVTNRDEFTAGDYKQTVLRTIEINSNGRITISTGSDMTISVNGNTNINTNGNTNISTFLNTNVTTQGNTTVQTTGNTTVTTGGNTEVGTTGNTKVTTGGNTEINSSGTTKITSGGAINIEGSVVTLKGQSTMVI